MENNNNAVFRTLASMNQDAYKETKNGLDYINWAHAYTSVMLAYPDMKYEVKKFLDPMSGYEMPYVYDERLGYMVFTSITIQGDTREMWLPVMDSTNHAMKTESYKYQTRYQGRVQERVVPAVTMSDINRSIMRCLVKNMAMFGFGISLYSGVNDEIEAPAETVRQEAVPPVQLYQTRPAQEIPAVSYTEIPTAPVTPVANTQMRDSSMSRNVTNNAGRPVTADPSSVAPLTPDLSLTPAPQSVPTAASQITDMPVQTPYTMALNEAMNFIGETGRMKNRRFGDLVSQAKSERASMMVLNYYCNSGSQREKAAASAILATIKDGTQTIHVGQAVPQA